MYGIMIKSVIKSISTKKCLILSLTLTRTLNLNFIHTHNLNLKKVPQ